MPSPPLSDVEYGALWAYSPRGTSVASRRSQILVRDGLKQCKSLAGVGPVATLAARLLSSEPTVQPLFARFFHARTVLVPVPRSTPLQKGMLWPAWEFCRAFQQAGLATGPHELLDRVRPVGKSALAPPGERPTVEQHLETLAVVPGLERPDEITLVDDVLTKGRTMVAAAALLRAHFPGVVVRAFALARTRSLVPEIDKIRDPFVGVLRVLDGDVEREG